MDRTYIWQRNDWPSYRWDSNALLGPLSAARLRQGRLLGRMADIGFNTRNEMTLEATSEEVIQSSSIEGELLDREKVRSSVARRLGIDIATALPEDRKVEGVVAMLLDATQRCDQILTRERLLSWHAAMFPTGYSGLTKITVGDWRKDLEGPMQVVSGPFGQESVHYQAPPANRLEDEMIRFLDWFNNDASLDGLLKAALAHLWFVTIHPLDDGNGRVSRALSDLLLARSEQSQQQFYSMSSQIKKEREDYYEVLKQTQRGDLDVTRWIVWFLGCLDRAIESSSSILDAVMEKSRIWRKMAGVTINERQRKILNMLIDGFHGNLTSSKWASITKCSHDTALRDLRHLVENDILVQTATAGRNVNYVLAR